MDGYWEEDGYEEEPVYGDEPHYYVEEYYPEEPEPEYDQPEEIGSPARLPPIVLIWVLVLTFGVVGIIIGETTGMDDFRIASGATLAKETSNRMVDFEMASGATPAKETSTGKLRASWPESIRQWEPFLVKYGEKHGHDPNLLAAHVG